MTQVTPLVAVSRCPAAAGVITSHHHPLEPSCYRASLIVYPVLIILWTRQYVSAVSRGEIIWVM